MLEKKDTWLKITILIAVTIVTLAIHYGLLMLIFGHASWVHAIHGRLCYIPIVIAASWFGLRGGIWSALTISLLVLPYIFYFGGDHVNSSAELFEIIFYFALAVLTGGLIDRESRIQEKHEQTQLQLERAHKLSMIGQMAAGIAHEIKNPLASVQGAFEILCHNNTTDTEKAEFQDIVYKEIKRIDGTVSEFLEFARPKEFNLKRIDISESMNNVIKQMRGQIDNAGVKLETDIKNNLFVMADEQKIRQVIINLILNAIDASPSNGTIKISSYNYDSKACIAFEDEGAGIKETDRGKIFEPFYTTKAKGTGLGLAIIKSIVDRHTGTITVENIEKKGARFIIALPLAEAE